MQVKQIERTANVAWSPRDVVPVYLAAGTAAQQLDASFSTSAALEVYALNLQDPSNDLSLLSSIPSDQRFHTITWGNYGGGNGTIVAGCDGGIIQVYNASKFINKEDALVGKYQKHSGSVRALDFNTYQNNLLVSGAAESEIFIWDLNNPATPMSPGPRVQPPEDITSLEWNNQVQHILATASSSRCVVWDLRKKDPIMKLTDTSCRLKWCSVAWNPDVATQLCLASEDDQTPFIQLWDLRFATSPVKVLAGHQKGVLSLSWCRQDTEILLSCGRDNRILCWNPNSPQQEGELICDMTSPSQWNFSAAWCPRNPALFTTCSFDGHVSVNSMVGGPQQPQTSTKIADSFPGMELYAQAPPPLLQSHPITVDLRKPPKWLKRPATARFGFGGKLVITGQKSVTVCQVTSEPGVVARANLLDAAVRHDNCLEYARGKVAAAVDEDEKTLWQFLSASFTTNPKEEFIRLLGFQREDITSKLNQLRMQNGPSERLATLGRSTDTESDLDASDYIAEETNSHFVQNSETSTGRRPRSYKISTTDDVDGLICEALLLGDIPAAVELCVEDARWADAMILAMAGGDDLLANTRHRYLQNNPGILSKLVAAAVTEDWVPVVENCDPSSWREALVAALTHSPDQFPFLCETLGARLEPRVAQICFLCAGNIDRLVSAWLKVNNASSPSNLQDLVEIIMLLKRAVESRGLTVNFSGQIADILSRYAIILTSEGNLEMALSYLETSQDEGMVQLRERIYRAAGLRGQPAQYQQQPQQVQHERTTKAGYPGNQPAASNYQGYQPPTVVGYPPASGTAPTPGLYNPDERRVSSAAAVPPLGDPPYGARTASPSITGKTGRARHVLDPSVASTPAPSSFYSGASATTPYQFSSNQTNTAPYGSQPMPTPYGPLATPYASQPAPTPFGTQPASTPFGNQPVATPYGTPAPYGVNPPPSNLNLPAPQATPPPPPPTTYIAQPPGWNDPPPLSSRQPSTKKEIVAPASLITAPLFGGPQPAVNGVYDPYQQNQQNNYGMPLGQQAPPPTNFPPTSNQPGLPPSQPPYAFNNQVPYPSQQQPTSSFPQSQAFNSYPPPSQTPNSFPLQSTNSFPPQSSNSFPPQSTPNTFVPQSQAPTSFAPQLASNNFPGVQYESNQPTQAAQPPPQLQQPAPPVKKTIPEEHIHLHTVLEELKTRCIAAATNVQSKRKLEDVARKLESLYDSLADNKLSSATLQALHGIGQRVQSGDYTGSLAIHSQLVSGPDFVQIAPFMPGIKVLLQTALQLQVYL